MTYWYNDSINRRYKSQNRFKRIGFGAVVSIFIFIGVLLSVVSYQAYPAFQKTYIAVDVKIDKNIYSRKSIYDYMYERFDATSRKDKKALKSMFSSYANIELDAYKKENLGLNNEYVRVWLSASDVLDQYMKGHITKDISESRRSFSDKQMNWAKKMVLTEQIQVRFNKDFFSNGDSREAGQAGILGALIGSLMTVGVCLLLTLIVGVSGAIYLEEFAPKNRCTMLIESTINNLASVPSIIFGLLGLVVLLNTFGMPRSTAIVGGSVLAMMSLPTIVIATRNALNAIPDSLRFAALALGTTRLQMVMHHVVPKATPSILTGVIIAIAQALGETAPLLMIGMVAFVVDVPAGLMEPAVTLPVQIFLWADVPETAFIEKTSAAILVLLFIVCSLIAIAGYMRHKFENKV